MNFAKCRSERRAGESSGLAGVDECFYEKVIKVKADVAALLTFLVLCGFRHISAENFGLGSLRSDDWQCGRPTAPPLWSVFRVFSPPNGQLRTTQEDFATFFQGLNAARVVIEVGTHSAWVQEVIRGCGHEVLVANPRLMDGSKRRERKNEFLPPDPKCSSGSLGPPDPLPPSDGRD